MILCGTICCTDWLCRQVLCIVIYLFSFSFLSNSHSLTLMDALRLLLVQLYVTTVKGVRILG